MKVRITQVGRTPLQSGLGNENIWTVTLVPEKNRRYINKLTGWTSSDDTRTQVKLKFISKEDAIKYAQDNNLEYEVYEADKPTIKPKSYSDNFTAPILETVKQN